MKKILGLDLGTNSIGWAVVNANEEIENEKLSLKPFEIETAGSRIIPMDAGILGKFEQGNSISQTADRTGFRGTRRLRERHLLRRERLHRVLNVLEFLPEHYKKEIGWNKEEPKTFGKFINNAEPKLPWDNGEFLFMDSFNEMLEDFEEGMKVPYDWTIYYLRKKSLTEKISKQELAWILLNFNQKRGYYQLRGEDEENEDKREFVIEEKIVGIEKGDAYKNNPNKTWYKISLENGWSYSYHFTTEPQWLNQTKEFLITEELDKDGNIKVVKDKKNDSSGREKRTISLLPSFEEIDKMEKKDQDKIFKKIKAKTEITIDKSKKTVGEYIYDTLLQKPNQKIRGKLIRTIERKFYKDELCTILKKQKELHTELENKDLYIKCINELYAQNEEHKNNIASRDFIYLFLDDIIFYQRPLKSKKSLISNCAFEVRCYEKEDENGNKTTIKQPLKCAPKSNPYFQELRLWKFIANLKFYEREKTISDGQLNLFGEEVVGKIQTDVDVTNEFLKDENAYTALFDWLNERKEITQDTLLNSYFNIKKPKGKDSVYPYRWNYVEDKAYPCNETNHLIISGLKKTEITTELTTEQKYNLWHILYSVNDKKELETALGTFASKHNLHNSLVDVFKNTKSFKSEYGAYSEKAIKKLLQLMRMGTYWNERNINDKTRERIEKIIDGEFDEKISNRVREKAISLNKIDDFKGLPEWLVCYIVYNRFSEAKEIVKWKTPEDLDQYIKSFKQHSLRNPIVEQLITETLRTVRDIWIQVGQIDEIHVELGREMKNPADKRKKMTANISANENTNLRIKAMLMEFQNSEYNIEGEIRPYSNSQQEILKIYEEYALSNINPDNETKENIDFIGKISKTAEPTKNDILRYRLWLEQKYRSPYTGEMIPLSKLFTTAYEIEHVIPKSRFFDDSFKNKVICEAEVNALKDRKLGYEFIKEHSGQKVQIANKKHVTILSTTHYEDFVKEHYSNLKPKMRILLMDDIPDKFVERQLNDTRYISKEIKRLLSNIVREKDEKGEYEQEATSKNVIACTGAVTSRLKRDWGLSDKWNEIILPRFERMNELTQTNDFTTKNKEGHTIPTIPFELQKGFSFKRIDHRHHALDAIVIACTTRSHVQYLSNENAKSQKREIQKGLARKLRHFEETEICKKVKNSDGVWVEGTEKKKIQVAKEFLKPWETFPTDVKEKLDGIIVSIKQNLRVINKTTNYYQKYGENGKKESVKQTKGDSWAIRKQMHKDTVFGEVNLRKTKTVSLNVALENPKMIINRDLKEKVIELQNSGYDNKKIKKYIEDNQDVWSDVNVAKIDIYYFTKETKDRYFATRKTLDTSFDKKKIESITDTGIQKILLTHLELNNNDSDLAFSPEGIEEMNRNIKELNNGKNHHPIYKVRWYEKADKFTVGQNGNKKDKFVEAAKGTNLFFVVYERELYDKKQDENIKKRVFASVALNHIIECQKESKDWKQILDGKLKDKSIEEYSKYAIESTDKLLFILSPNDLVYVPTEDELKEGIDSYNPSQIYKFVSCTGKRSYFIPCRISQVIEDKKEYTNLNKLEFDDAKTKISEFCIPLKYDYLGNIIKVE